MEDKIHIGHNLISYNDSDGIFEFGNIHFEYQLSLYVKLGNICCDFSH